MERRDFMKLMGLMSAAMMIPASMMIPSITCSADATFQNPEIGYDPDRYLKYDKSHLFPADPKFLWGDMPHFWQKFWFREVKTTENHVWIPQRHVHWCQLEWKEAEQKHIEIHGPESRYTPSMAWPETMRNWNRDHAFPTGIGAKWTLRWINAHFANQCLPVIEKDLINGGHYNLCNAAISNPAVIKLIMATKSEKV